MTVEGEAVLRSSEHDDSATHPAYHVRLQVSLAQGTLRIVRDVTCTGLENSLS